MGGSSSVPTKKTCETCKTHYNIVLECSLENITDRQKCLDCYWVGSFNLIL